MGHESGCAVRNSPEQCVCRTRMTVSKQFEAAHLTPWGARVKDRYPPSHFVCGHRLAQPKRRYAMHRGTCTPCTRHILRSAKSKSVRHRNADSQESVLHWE